MAGISFDCQLQREAILKSVMRHSHRHNARYVFQRCNVNLKANRAQLLEGRLALTRG